ncbi:MAG: type II toxin-antitoxin system MqsA family antitoxin [Chloroflexi bacterium]|nr:type II toxin-antitoxin system MqsA family antitoxin [Chloroflexota bacterium]
MNCIICGQAEMIKGFTPVVFERDEFNLVVNNVPALVCLHCGEVIMDEETAIQLLDMAEGSAGEGIIELVCEYAPGRV